jgi:cell division protease FtsH
MSKNKGDKNNAKSQIRIEFGKSILEVAPEDIKELPSIFANLNNQNDIPNVPNHPALSPFKKHKNRKDLIRFLDHLTTTYHEDSTSGPIIQKIWDFNNKAPIVTRYLKELQIELEDSPLCKKFFELLEEDDDEKKENQKENATDDDIEDGLNLEVVKKSDISLKDVGGLDHVQDEVEDVMQIIKDPNKVKKLGGNVPKGILFSGPSGTGKTLSARAIAGECKVPFIPLHASQFESKWTGVGRDRIEQAFTKAKKLIKQQKEEGKAPSCILFIDELDSIGKSRNGDENHHDTILIELLAQMDGFKPAEGIVVMAATNRPESLDPALASRFEKKLTIPLPTIKGRYEILKIHTKNMPLKVNVDLKELAKKTFSFSGRDLKSLVNHAALNAAKNPNARKVGRNDFNEGLDKILLGTRRKLKMAIEEKEATAIHEAGHAIIGLRKEIEGVEPLDRVTVLPFDDALGVTLFRDEKERYMKSLKSYKADLVIDYGGRVAEELIYGDTNVSSAASGDIENATSVAELMVTQFGFNKKIGPIKVGNLSETFLGSSGGLTTDPETARIVREEIQILVDEAYEEAKKILTEDKKALIDLAKSLMEYESLERDEVIEITGIHPQKPKVKRLKDLNKAL